ncbi:TPA: protease FtsH-inhibitory lysogeny factor CIII [Escherichia coli]|nr:protease FtsH-inhibitory lysogeny factor CIII [Escherichia coli]
MIYAIAGGARMGAFQLNESLLERITRKLRDGWKRVEVLLCAMKYPLITRCFVLHRTKQ